MSWDKQARKSVSSRDALHAELDQINPFGKRRAIDSSLGVEKVVSALDQFQECVRYLNTRRSKGAVINLTKEADVQDVVYLMLRPWVKDIVPENPTDKVAGTFTIKDFLSKELHTVVEAKYVRDKKHGKAINAELHDDIENYRTHPYCDNLIFFIYDPQLLIPDRAGLKKHLEDKRNYNGKALQTYCVIKP